MKNKQKIKKIKQNYNPPELLSISTHVLNFSSVCSIHDIFFSMNYGFFIRVYGLILGTMTGIDGLSST